MAIKPNENLIFVVENLTKFVSIETFHSLKSTTTLQFDELLNCHTP